MDDAAGERILEERRSPRGSIPIARSSKRKLSGEFSMRFNFDGEPAPPRQQICVPDLPKSRSRNSKRVPPIWLEPEAAPRASPGTQLAAQSGGAASRVPPLLHRCRPSVPFKRKVVMEANVIEFPRLFPPEPPPSYARRGTVLPSVPAHPRRPRNWPAFPGNADPRRHAPRAPRTRAAPELELPLQVASVAPRMVTRLSRTACSCSSAPRMFALHCAYKCMAGWSGPSLCSGVRVLVPVVFWAAYEYLFLVYGGRTPGMAITQLSPQHLPGNRAESPPTPSCGCLASPLSCSSLMLGFLWAFFDEDTLCWHDRISRTYLVIRQ